MLSLIQRPIKPSRVPSFTAMQIIFVFAHLWWSSHQEATCLERGQSHLPSLETINLTISSSASFATNKRQPQNWLELTLKLKTVFGVWPQSFPRNFHIVGISFIFGGWLLRHEQSCEGKFMFIGRLRTLQSKLMRHSRETWSLNPYRVFEPFSAPWYSSNRVSSCSAHMDIRGRQSGDKKMRECHRIASTWQRHWADLEANPN